MKVEKQTSKKSIEIKFPLLMSHIDHRYIVYFVNKTTGFVIQSDNDNYHIGTFDHHIDISVYEPYTGVLTLENDLTK